jgi:ABC-type multidrug transport system fused ATPase/permease subunit
MTRKSLGILLVILAVSVALRVGVALYLGDIVDAPPLLTDQRSYHALGERLITGHGFSFDRGWYPFTAANTPTAHWSFLYSLFVAGVYGLFGPHPLAVRLVQAVLGGILLPLAVYAFSRRLFSAEAWGDRLSARGFKPEVLALTAAGISAVYFYFVLYAATLMTETLYISALLWSLCEALALAQHPTRKHAVLLGVSLGAATLLRQSILPWIAVMFVWLLWVGYRARGLRRSSGAVAIAAGLIALMILPFTVRNYAAYGQFLLLNSNAGYAMFSAQHPMHGTDFKEFEGAPMPKDLSGLNEAQLDQVLMQRGISFVLAEPGRYLLLSASRIPDYFEFWPTPDTALLNNVGRVGSIGLLLPFVLTGLVMAVRMAGPKALGGWRTFSTTPLAMLLLFILIYSLLHIFTWAMPRYRLPVDAVAISFAALALDTLALMVIKRWRTSAAEATPETT